MSQSTPAHISKTLKQIWLGLFLSFIFLTVFTFILPQGHALDMWISQGLYNASTGEFLFNNDTSWVEVLLHDWAKNALLLMPVYALVQVLVGYWVKRVRGLTPTQYDAWQRWAALLFAAVLSMLLITYLKKWSNQTCPWSLVDFGGEWPYADFFTVKPWGDDKQSCWPAGHASGGFILLSLAFVGGWPPNMWNVRLRTQAVAAPKGLGARAFVWYALVIGTVLGFARVSQGAHFFSHQFWSLWWIVLANMLFLKMGLFKIRWLMGGSSVSDASKDEGLQSPHA
ncbi:phosphatase PAP2 family protein [Hydromonas duriensis]|uniref:Membrane-associated PAP2 superfamily phosphatase n=1 Tax=Hydromonas duriensis TaxID=1527608 RepID=A0A4R6YA94_9BURK|nr:phosphatase PAP2 family protein [Hydromonas duriensis]TDR32399.1 membrane-associated PAP2 superfamily phosphatase [Hydromonas duriensis]